MSDRFAPAAAQLRLTLEVGAVSDVGAVRQSNEDSYGLAEDYAAKLTSAPQGLLERKGRLYAVADGMGGHASGEIASRLAIERTFTDYYGNPTTDVPSALQAAIQQANLAIITQGQGETDLLKMGSTIVAGLFRADQLWVANVGDSRAYLFRAGQARQLTVDHSWVAEQVQEGILSPEQAKTHALRNVITRSLGTHPEVQVDIFRETLQPGDEVLICCDGLTGELPDEDVSAIVAMGGTSQEIAQRLVGTAKERGGRDNITAIFIKAQPSTEPTPAPAADLTPETEMPEETVPFAAMVAISLLSVFLGLALVGLWLFARMTPQLPPIAAQASLATPSPTVWFTPTPPVTATIAISASVTPSPVPTEITATILVDDMSPGFQKGGPEEFWGAEPSGYGQHFFWTRNATDKTENFGKWAPSLPKPGKYEVYAFIPEKLATTSSARYRINFSGQWKVAVINQGRAPRDSWVSLGVYTFAADGKEYVELSDATGEPYNSEYIALDAVKFVYVGP